MENNWIFQQSDHCGFKKSSIWPSDTVIQPDYGGYPDMGSKINALQQKWNIFSKKLSPPDPQNP